MIIGSATLRLIAKNECKLPVSHGRLLHAALLDIVRERDPELSRFMHNSKVNNFSVALLKVSSPVTNHSYTIKEGVVAYWRIGVIGERLLDLLWNLPNKIDLRIGAASFYIDSVFKKDSKDGELSKIDTEDFENNIINFSEKKYVTIKFLSPTTFSGSAGDYPMPLPKIIFGSLAERWNSFTESTSFNVKNVKEISEYLLPRRWEGRSCVYNISPKLSVPSFVGSFTYDLGTLPPEYRCVFIILAEFAKYTGIGRHTGQGMGRVEVKYA